MSALVLGLGNRDRGDDAVGLIVADRLGSRSLDVTVRSWTGADVDLLTLWAGFDRVIVIDAAVTGHPAGTTRRLEREDLADVVWPPSATHHFGLPAVVELAERLDRLPGHLEVWTIEAADVGLGRGLSPAVQQAADELIGVLAELFRPRPVMGAVPAGRGPAAGQTS